MTDNELLEVCKERFEYVDGQLIARHSYPRVKKGSVCGSIDSKGYLRVTVKGKKRLVHRVIFLMHHGYLPRLIDHIDQNPLNNHIENLREADERLNSLNVSKSWTNTGVRHISKVLVENKYTYFRLNLQNGKHKYFKTLEEAIQYKIQK